MSGAGGPLDAAALDRDLRGGPADHLQVALEALGGGTAIAANHPDELHVALHEHIPRALRRCSVNINRIRLFKLYILRI